MDASSAPLRLIFDPIGELLDATRACEAEVFLERYGNTAEQFQVEYGPYEDSTVFMALEARGRVVAACRIILPSAAGLKSLNDAAGPPWQIDSHRAAGAARIDLQRTWDVATICIRRDAGPHRHFAAAALYYGISQAARINGMQTLVMILDERARQLLTACGLVTRALPGTHPAPYLGSPASTPVYGHLAEMADVQRRLNPDAYRLIGQGVGLDGVALPAPEMFLLPETAMAPA